MVELTAAGPIRIRGPRGKLRWYPQPAVALTSPAGMNGFELLKWWLTRWQLKLKSAAKQQNFDAFREELGRQGAEDELLLSQSPQKAQRQATHWDLLAPLVSTTALHHLNAYSAALGGAWVGSHEGEQHGQSALAFSDRPSLCLLFSSTAGGVGRVAAD
eukprot:SAG22_NODE_341_length_11992_cov_180.308753_10_plen_159_part_00